MIQNHKSNKSRRLTEQLKTDVNTFPRKRRVIVHCSIINNSVTEDQIKDKNIKLLKKFLVVFLITTHVNNLLDLIGSRESTLSVICFDCRLLTVSAVKPINNTVSNNMMRFCSLCTVT